jgi:hypothetical protein
MHPIHALASVDVQDEHEVEQAWYLSYFKIPVQIPLELL